MSKKKIRTLAEAKEAAGITEGSGDYADLETVKVAALAEAGSDIVIYGADKLDSQFDEGQVYVVRIGDDKEEKAKFWTSHTALMHQLSRMVEHDLFPVSTKVVSRKSKAGRSYFDFAG